jgi:formyl-CoA transferase
VLIVNTPHPARKKLKLEYEDIAQWNPRLIYADVTGYGEKGPDASLPGFDITAYWARSGLLSLTRDAGAPPTFPVRWNHARRSLCFRDTACTGASAPGRFCTTSPSGGSGPAAFRSKGFLCDATFSVYDRLKPPNALINVYKASDENWFVLVLTPDQIAGSGEGRRPRMLTARDSLISKTAANSAEPR